MKKTICAYLLGISLTLALTGCSGLSSASGENADTVVNSEYVTIGSRLTVHNTDERLTLLNNMDTLSSDGLYYASWTSGDSEPYENADGDTVDLYDAQLYLLSGEFKSAETAETSAADWLAAGRSNYDVSKEENVTCDGVNYTVITYTFVNEENPYARGVSAFGVYENCAVCIELTCREGYAEDLNEMLTAFLERCSYE
ncbi:MAG: hypothetical protein NC416_14310 [Eubacterium sp.]|nr:hypothetical protein [Eubacterium sp.]